MQVGIGKIIADACKFVCILFIYVGTYKAYSPAMRTIRVKTKPKLIKCRKTWFRFRPRFPVHM